MAYACEVCGKKGRAKDTKNGPKCVLHAHHIDGINWDGLVDLYRRRVLCPPDRLKIVCTDCHKEMHDDGKA